jgi:bifunctional non-homologous end joining protein LigD
MKAVSGDLPHGEGWAFEIKWDGIRAIAEVRDGHLSLWSSNAIEMTVLFPELAGLAGAVGPARAVLDGEIVAFDEHDRPSFGLLQQRMHLTEPTAVARQMVEVPQARLNASTAVWIYGSKVNRLAGYSVNEVCQRTSPVIVR